jgi:hypothetical protein
LKSEAERGQPFRTLEERMVKYQRECDERARAELASQMERFKELELSRIRLEEAAKYREALNNERLNLERKMNEKMDKMRTKEQEMNDALQKKEQVLISISKWQEGY